MTEQLRLVPGEDPDRLLAMAKERWNPIRTYCMFSGGNDSTAVAHRFRDQYDALFHINTETGVEEEGGPSVIAHVRSVAEFLRKPLYVVSAGDAYTHMVLGGGVRPSDGRPHVALGFPGPGQHGRAYTRLKERQVEAAVRETKRGHHRSSAVLFISGIRRDESQRRKGRMPLTEHGSAKYVNPLIDWTGADLLRYRREHDLPESDVSALAHRSGECNCGAFAKADIERPMMADLFPQTFGRIREMEVEAERRGLRWCRWGGFDREGNRCTDESDEQVGPACAGCARLFELESPRGE